MLGSHLEWTTLLLGNLRMISITSTVGKQGLEIAAVAGEETRKILLKLMLHTNKTRTPRKQARPVDVEVFSL